ncbi:MAG: Rpn family recombination-promoting nuclease/putative transposase, partial [Saprospiraceae bacterium]
MQDGVHNIHDKFVRESFSDPVRAIAFLERFLPDEMINNLDLPTLRVLQESYLNEALKEHFSDLVFEISLKQYADTKTDISILFEHKSSPDKHVLIQVGHYMFAHWVKCLAEKKKLKVIIPMIYYQGKKEWTLADLSSLFDSYPDFIKNHIPTLNYLFFALNTISEDKIETIRDTMMAAAVIAQKWRINPVKLQADFERIFRLFPLKDPNWNFLEKIVVYALNVSDITEEVLAETIKSIPQPIKDNIMTTYDRIVQKNRNEGVQIGIQKGKI